MPLTSPSRHVLSVSHDVRRAENAWGSIQDLDNKLAEVSNSLYASRSAICEVSIDLARALTPMLCDAMEHEQAARPKIEEVFQYAKDNLPHLRFILHELRKGRMYRRDFKGGDELRQEARMLYKKLFTMWEAVGCSKLIADKSAETALEYAKQLADQLDVGITRE